jgi:hypothetical protein
MDRECISTMCYNNQFKMSRKVFVLYFRTFIVPMILGCSSVEQVSKPRTFGSPKVHENRRVRSKYRALHEATMVPWSPSSCPSWFEVGRWSVAGTT